VHRRCMNSQKPKLIGGTFSHADFTYDHQRGRSPLPKSGGLSP
jgi:hypothetical protein